MASLPMANPTKAICRAPCCAILRPGFCTRDYSPETGVRPGYVRARSVRIKERTLTIPCMAFQTRCSQVCTSSR